MSWRNTSRCEMLLHASVGATSMYLHGCALKRSTCHMRENVRKEKVIVGERRGVGNGVLLPSCWYRSSYRSGFLGLSYTMYLNFDQSIWASGTRCAIFIASWKFSRPNLEIEKKKKPKRDEYVVDVIEITVYHNSPSKKRSDGIASMISCGKVNLLPLLEKNAFLSGFQNPRTPSYFSNIHLIRRESQRVKAN